MGDRDWHFDIIQMTSAEERIVLFYSLFHSFYSHMDVCLYLDGAGVFRIM